MYLYLMVLAGAVLGLLCGMRLTLPDYVTTDTWWHLELGRTIWGTKSLPRADVYSWTVPGSKVYAHEWLFEVLLWLSYSRFGYAGVLVFGALPVVLAALVAAKMLGKHRLNSLAAPLVYVSSLLPVVPMLTCRPHLYTLFFAYLWLYAYTSNRKLLWMLPPALFVWVNMHSGALLGVAVSLGFFVASLIPGFKAGKIRNTQSKHRKAFALTFLLVATASFLNPMGPGVYVYAFRTLGEELFRKYIQEWTATPFGAAEVQLYYYLPLAVLLAGFLLNRRGHVELYAMLLFFTALVKGAAQFRWMGFLGFASFPALLGAWKGAGEKPKAKYLLAGLLLGLAAAFATGFPSDLEEAAVSGGYPVQAVGYLEDGEKVLNHYGCGGYLIYRGKKVFIDGRADFYAFHSEVFRDYVKFAEKLDRSILDKYGVRAVLWPSGTAVDSYLRASGWKEKYRDRKWVLYEKG